MDYDVFAESIIAQYQQFASGLHGQALAALLDNKMDAAQLGKTQASLQEAVPLLLKGVTHLARAYADREATPLLGGEVSGLDDALATLTDLVARSAQLLVANTAQHLRKFAIGQQMADINMAGPFAELKAQRMKLPELTIANARGHARNALEYLRMGARAYAVEAHLLASIAKHRDAGKDVMTVGYPDENHRYHGMEISISGRTPGAQVLDVIRRAVFHPNTQARVQ